MGGWETSSNVVVALAGASRFRTECIERDIPVIPRGAVLGTFENSDILLALDIFAVTLEIKPIADIVFSIIYGNVCFASFWGRSDRTRKTANNG